MTTYREYASQLMSETSKSWLPDFRDLEREVSEYFARDYSVAKNLYNPHLIEQNLSKLAASIDKILAIQSVINEIEEKALYQVIEYAFQDQRRDILTKLETQEWVSLGLVRASELHQADSAAFAQSDHELADGFSALSSTARALAKEQVTHETERAQGLRELRQTDAERQTVMERRHIQAGHPLNFKERITRAYGLFDFELEEAFERTVAVLRGISSVFGYRGADNPIYCGRNRENPFFSNTDIDLQSFCALGPNNNVLSFSSGGRFLDRLIAQTRRWAQAYRSLQQRELIFQHTISMAQMPSLGRRAGRLFEFNWGGPNLASTSGTRFSQGEADLSDYFPEFEVLRILRVGVSVDTKYSSEEEKGWDSYFTKMHLSYEANQNHDQIGKPTDTAFFDHVTGFRPYQRVQFHTPNSMVNVDPRKNWRWKLSGNIYSKDRALLIENGDVTDVKLHFVLAAFGGVDEDSWLPNTEPFWG
ncbi:MAG: hypothetical protein ABJP48_12530 [Erythrobacter sp.]